MQHEACIKCGQVGLFETQQRGSSTRSCICGALYHPCALHPHVHVNGPSPAEPNTCSCEVPVGSCPRCHTNAEKILDLHGGTKVCPRCNFYFHMCEAHPANVVGGKAVGSMAYRDCSCGVMSVSGAAGAHETHVMYQCRDWRADSRIFR